MDRLFCASLKRVWKNKCFWLCMGAMSAYIIWYMRSRCQIVSEDLTARLQAKTENNNLPGFFPRLSSLQNFSFFQT